MTTTQRRARILDALSRAFPAESWTARRQSIRGVLGAIAVTLDVADIYGARGCSEVVVYPRGKSQTWDSLARVVPKSGSPRAVIAAVRKALREVEKLQAAVHSAVRMLECEDAAKRLCSRTEEDSMSQATDLEAALTLARQGLHGPAGLKVLADEIDRLREEREQKAVRAVEDGLAWCALLDQKQTEVATLIEERDRARDRYQVEHDEVERLKTMLSMAEARIEADKRWRST